MVTKLSLDSYFFLKIFPAFIPIPANAGEWSELRGEWSVLHGKIFFEKNIRAVDNGFRFCYSSVQKPINKWLLEITFNTKKITSLN